MAALAVGFAGLSFLLGSVIVGRLAAPAGLVIAVVSGVFYAVAIRAFTAHTDRRRARLRRMLVSGMSRGGATGRPQISLRLTAPSHPVDPR